jgi:dimethylamine/trimethylamine dehydrogenase
LFEPVDLGPHVARNRFYKTPHCSGFGVDRPGAQAHFRAVAAEGGWGVVNTEACSIHPSSDDSPEVFVRLWDDEDVRSLSLLCDLVHEHDSLVGVELWYGAGYANNQETRLPAAGVSQIASDAGAAGGAWQCCYEMTKGEIRELQRFYVAAARRAQSAGFDIVNVYGGHGGPITYQFLSRFHNKRADEYGGSLHNRARFWLETLEQVRGAVGDSCVVCARICIEAFDDRRTTLDETLEFVEMADHLVDLWDLTVGGVLAEWGEDTLASRFASENFQRPWIEQVRPHSSKPLVGVGRFVSPDTMLAMIRRGLLDLIGSARGSIADPFLPRKIEEGRLDDIRECIGCNVCVSRNGLIAPIICTQNATAGEEYRRGWHPERFTRAANADRDVLIVGAGPAGMECAVVLAKRGMRRIHLVDAERELGGCMRWIPRLPGLGEWARVVDYRKIQIDKLQKIEFIPGLHMDVHSVLDYGADIVVVATGARWATDGLNGVTHEPIPGADAALEFVLTPEQIMLDAKEVPGERVVVLDCEGYFMGVSLAERLARSGRLVTFITPFSDVAPYTFYTLEGPRLTRLMHQFNVRLLTQHFVREVRPGTVEASNVYAPDAVVAEDTDSVVLVTQRLSVDPLYRRLTEANKASTIERARIAAIYRIGDCVTPRLIADAIFDGHRLAREIDTDDPATPLPFIRERRLLTGEQDQYDSVVDGSRTGFTPRSATPVA